MKTNFKRLYKLCHVLLRLYPLAIPLVIQIANIRLSPRFMYREYFILSKAFFSLNLGKYMNKKGEFSL